MATLATIASMTITTFSAKEAKNNFGRLLDEAREAPIAVEKNGRRVVVVISAVDYDEFEAQRDAYWGSLASKASKKGYIGVSKSMKFLKDSINARN